VWFCVAGILAPGLLVYGQERVAPLNYNGALDHHQKPAHRAARTTVATPLTLPFFEDFTGYSPYPDSTKWVEDEVYVNNTMCVRPVSRGVATFDCLNQFGGPYDSIATTDFRYCDSLTSQPIDISLNTPADSIYLSFFYQPQGNGFYPSLQDSLNLYLKNRYGDYTLVWSAQGSTLLPFQQVMIPITDTLLFSAAFQFRFANFGALNYADADWNIDYIRMDKNRTIGDTAVNDIAWSSDPGFLLNDYTSMPYRQFMANPIGERAAAITDSMHNDQNGVFPTSWGYGAVALNTGSVLQAPSVVGTINLQPYTIQPVSANVYTTTIPSSSVGLYDKVVFQNTFFVQPNAGTGNTTNDTIVKDQVFDNYLAYDDGTAEKSYYLNLSSAGDGRIAIEYHLDQPDTMRGMAVYFGRTSPLQSYKSFSFLVYKSLIGIEGATSEDTLYTEDYFTPSYVDTINRFWIYTFAHPIGLPSGTFYAGTMQYAESGDDSMYIGLDVNRIGSNHVFYNVLEAWQPSTISGALMIRPILGQGVLSSSVPGVQQLQHNWDIMPNPATDEVQFTYDNTGSADYTITDITGHQVMHGRITSGQHIDIARLVSGMYFAALNINGVLTVPKKMIKL
jgi:hypothetical protein